MECNRLKCENVDDSVELSMVIDVIITLKVMFKFKVKKEALIRLHNVDCLGDVRK